MPPVASEATTHSFKPTLPNPARSAHSSDRAQNSPFESLLDSSTQSASQHPAQASPVSSNRNPHTRQANSDQVRGKSADKRADKAADNSATQPASKADAAKTAAPGTTARDDKAPSDGKAIADADSSKQAAADDATNSAGDGAQADAPTQVMVPVDVAGIPIPTAPDNGDPTVPAVGLASPPAPGESAPSTDIAAVAPPTTDAPTEVLPSVTNTPPPDTTDSAPSGGFKAAAPGKVPQTAIDAVLQTKAAAHAAILAADAPMAKPHDVAGKSVDGGKTADDSNALAKPAFASSGDGKSEVADSAVKPAAANPHDDVQAPAHHPGNVEAPAAPDTRAAAPNLTANAGQQVPLPPSSQAVSQAAANLAVPTPPAATAVAVPFAGIAIEIANKALAGKNHFEIRLDPPELGRIEVRLQLDRDGNMTTRMIADRSDTLDLLRRDASGLERALQDAGLKTSDNGLQFSLRDQTMGRDQSHTPAPGTAQIIVNDEALPVNELAQRNYSRLAGLRGGIDIRV